MSKLPQKPATVHRGSSSAAADRPSFNSAYASGAPDTGPVHAPYATPAPEPLHIFRLTPVAREDDPRWLGRKPPGEVVVRARSPADARVVAAAAEEDFLDVDAKPSHGTSTEFASCFRDLKLYRVDEISDSGFPRQGGRAVLQGDFNRKVVRRSR